MEKEVGGGEGRGRWGEPEGRAAVAEWARSGASAMVFAQSRGFSAKRLEYWKRRLRAPSSSAFMAVALPSQGREPIEIVSEGVSVRVREDLDVEHVARIVSALARRGRGC